MELYRVQLATATGLCVWSASIQLNILMVVNVCVFFTFSH